MRRTDPATFYREWFNVIVLLRCRELRFKCSCLSPVNLYYIVCRSRLMKNRVTTAYKSLFYDSDRPFQEHRALFLLRHLLLRMILCHSKYPQCHPCSAFSSCGMICNSLRRSSAETTIDADSSVNRPSSVNSGVSNTAFTVTAILAQEAITFFDSGL